MTFRRVIHQAVAGGSYRQIPFSVKIRREGKGGTLLKTQYYLNNQAVAKPVVQDLSGYDRLDLELVRVYGGKDDTI